jgi:hypothetical protein
MQIPTVISVVCLLIDIVLNLNTAYYEYGQVVSKRSQIINNYVSRGFILDVISSCSVFAITVSEIVNYGKFVESSSDVQYSLIRG